MTAAEALPSSCEYCVEQAVEAASSTGLGTSSFPPTAALHVARTGDSLSKAPGRLVDELHHPNDKCRSLNDLHLSGLLVVRGIHVAACSSWILRHVCKQRRLPKGRPAGDPCRHGSRRREQPYVLLSEGVGFCKSAPIEPAVAWAGATDACSRYIHNNSLIKLSRSTLNRGGACQVGMS